MSSIYALIPLDGSMQFRDGIPDQGTVATFTIHRAAWGGHGLRGDFGDVEDPAGASPLNPVATSVVSALGGPDRRILGDLTIGGDRFEPGSGETVACGLTEAQQHLIRDVHTAVRRNA